MPLCDYCDRPAAYALCVERACEEHATPKLRELVALEIRNAAMGTDASRDFQQDQDPTEKGDRQ